MSVLTVLRFSSKPTQVQSATISGVIYDEYYCPCTKGSSSSCATCVTARRRCWMILVEPLHNWGRNEACLSNQNFLEDLDSFYLLPATLAGKLLFFFFSLAFGFKRNSQMKLVPRPVLPSCPNCTYLTVWSLSFFYLQTSGPCILKTHDGIPYTTTFGK